MPGPSSPSSSWCRVHPLSFRVLRALRVGSNVHPGLQLLSVMRVSGQRGSNSCKTFHRVMSFSNVIFPLWAKLDRVELRYRLLAYEKLIRATGCEPLQQPTKDTEPHRAPGKQAFSASKQLVLQFWANKTSQAKPHPIPPCCWHPVLKSCSFYSPVTFCSSLSTSVRGT